MFFFRKISFELKQIVILETGEKFFKSFSAFLPKEAQKELEDEQVGVLAQART